MPSTHPNPPTTPFKTLLRTQNRLVSDRHGATAMLPQRASSPAQAPPRKQTTPRRIHREPARLLLLHNPAATTLDSLNGGSIIVSDKPMGRMGDTAMRAWGIRIVGLAAVSLLTVGCPIAPVNLWGEVSLDEVLDEADVALYSPDGVSIEEWPGATREGLFSETLYALPEGRVNHSRDRRSPPRGSPFQEPSSALSKRLNTARISASIW